MGFLDWLFGKRDKQETPLLGHAVLVHFEYSGTDLSALHALEDRLEQLIARAGVGEYDGNEISIAGSDGTLFMYGPDADALFAVIRPTLEATPFTKGARVTLRYGPPEDGVKEAEVVLGT